MMHAIGNAIILKSGDFQSLAKDRPTVYMPGK
jgi:hypothetical protein